jgi:hypothetical protein
VTCAYLPSCAWPFARSSRRSVCRFHVHGDQLALPMLLLGGQRDAHVPAPAIPRQRGRSHDLGSGFSELDRCLTFITDSGDVSDVGSLLISIINEPRGAQQLAIVTDHEGLGRRVSDHRHCPSCTAGYAPALVLAVNDDARKTRLQSNRWPLHVGTYLASAIDREVIDGHSTYELAVWQAEVIMRDSTKKTLMGLDNEATRPLRVFFRGK